MRKGTGVLVGSLLGLTIWGLSCDSKEKAPTAPIGEAAKVTAPTGVLSPNATKNTAPVANAGPDQSVTAGTMVQLDGRGSTDVEKDHLSYRWTAPSGITLSSSTATRPTFTTNTVGKYRISLAVNDGKLRSRPDTVVITVTAAKRNTAPVANAGADQSVTAGMVVQLDGKGSSDAENDPLSYRWTAPSGITLSSSTATRPTFTTNTVGKYRISLAVNDGKVDSKPDTVVITVTAAKKNTAPVANAGADQSVTAGDLVRLDASGSTDADKDPLTYRWAVPSGIKLSSSTAAKPTFTTNTVGKYQIVLTVNDGKVDSKPDTVVVTVTKRNTSPVANAGVDQSVTAGTAVQLDGSGSTDTDNDPLTYRWAAPADITLSSSTASNPSFTPNTAGTYEITLVVNDGLVDSKPDTVVIAVAEVTQPEVVMLGMDNPENPIVAVNDYGDQMGLIHSDGAAPDEFSGAFFISEGDTVGVLHDENGRPTKIYLNDQTVILGNYTDQTVDLAYVDPNGTISLYREVPLPPTEEAAGKIVGGIPEIDARQVVNFLWEWNSGGLGSAVSDEITSAMFDDSLDKRFPKDKPENKWKRALVKEANLSVQTLSSFTELGAELAINPANPMTVLRILKLTFDYSHDTTRNLLWDTGLVDIFGKASTELTAEERLKADLAAAKINGRALENSIDRLAASIQTFKDAEKVYVDEIANGRGGGECYAEVQPDGSSYYFFDIATSVYAADWIVPNVVNEIFRIMRYNLILGVSSTEDPLLDLRLYGFFWQTGETIEKGDRHHDRYSWAYIPTGYPEPEGGEPLNNIYGGEFYDPVLCTRMASEYRRLESKCGDFLSRYGNYGQFFECLEAEKGP